MPSEKKRKRNGTETTRKGGRPVDPVARRQRQADVVRLRSEGLTYDAIAERLGCAKQTCQAAYARYWDEEAGLVKDTADQLRVRETHRLEGLMLKNYRMAMDAEIVVERDVPGSGVMQLEEFQKLKECTAGYVKCATLLAQLHGLSKPTEINVSGTLPLDTLARVLEAADTAAHGTK